MGMPIDRYLCALQLDTQPHTGLNAPGTRAHISTSQLLHITGSRRHAHPSLTHSHIVVGILDGLCNLRPHTLRHGRCHPEGSGT